MWSLMVVHLAHLVCRHIFESLIKILPKLRPSSYCFISCEFILLLNRSLYKCLTSAYMLFYRNNTHLKIENSTVPRSICTKEVMYTWKYIIKMVQIKFQLLKNQVQIQNSIICRSQASTRFYDVSYITNIDHPLHWYIVCTV